MRAINLNQSSASVFKFKMHCFILFVTWPFKLDIKHQLANAHGSILEHVVEACAGGFYAAPMADEVTDFFTTHPLPSIQRKISQVGDIYCESLLKEVYCVVSFVRQ